MKKFFTNQSFWHAAMAFISAILSGCYIMEDHPLIAFCWALSSVCYIAMFALDKTKDKDEKE